MRKGVTYNREKDGLYIGDGEQEDGVHVVFERVVQYGGGCNGHNARVKDWEGCGCESHRQDGAGVRRK